MLYWSVLVFIIHPFVLLAVLALWKPSLEIILPTLSVFHCSFSGLELLRARYSSRSQRIRLKRLKSLRKCLKRGNKKVERLWLLKQRWGFFRQRFFARRVGGPEGIWTPDIRRARAAFIPLNYRPITSWRKEGWIKTFISITDRRRNISLDAE